MGHRCPDKLTATLMAKLMAALTPAFKDNQAPKLTRWSASRSSAPTPRCPRLSVRVPHHLPRRHFHSEFVFGRAPTDNAARYPDIYGCRVSVVRTVTTSITARCNSRKVQKPMVLLMHKLKPPLMATLIPSLIAKLKPNLMLTRSLAPGQPALHIALAATELGDLP